MLQQSWALPAFLELLVEQFAGGGCKIYGFYEFNPQFNIRKLRISTVYQTPVSKPPTISVKLMVAGASLNHA